jgi:hypothetical protein
MASLIKNLNALSATAAYSFRQLGTNYVPAGYAGNCLLVRRDWDGATLDIGFSAGWRDDVTLLDFVTGSGTHPNANGTIQIWYDQSGNGLDAINLTINNQPDVVIDGDVVSKNGKPSSNFDGNAFLDASYTNQHFTNICISVFFLYSISVIDVTRTAFSIGSDVNNNHLGIGIHNVGAYNFYDPTSGLTQWSHHSLTTDLLLFVARNIYTIADMSFRTNSILGGELGSSVESSSSIVSYRNNVLDGSISIGRGKLYGSNLNGFVSELIIFNNNNQDCLINETRIRESDIISTYGI